MSSVGFCLLLILLALCALSSETSPQQDGEQGQSKALVAATKAFEFHSGFWLNLHTHLYLQAKQQQKRFEEDDAKSTSPAVDEQCLAQLSKEAQQDWSDARNYYLSNVIQHPLLSGDKMRPIKITLAVSQNAPDLQDSRLSTDLIKLLERTGPVYRKCWWSEHDSTNRNWIQSVIPLMKQYGDTLIEQLTAIYRADWPDKPIRVDVVNYAGWSGANTGYFYHQGGTVSHTVITSADPDYRGFASLEMLFHEASHRMVHPRSGAIGEEIARAAEVQDKPVPRNLWHAIIFYTAGRIVQRLLAEEGMADYRPYAYKNKIFSEYLPVLEQHWQPYLDGHADFTAAMANVIKAL